MALTDPKNDIILFDAHKNTKLCLIVLMFVNLILFTGLMCYLLQLTKAVLACRLADLWSTDCTI